MLSRIHDFSARSVKRIDEATLLPNTSHQLSGGLLSREAEDPFHQNTARWIPRHSGRRGAAPHEKSPGNVWHSLILLRGYSQ